MENQLKRLRIEKKMTQQQVADAIGVKVATYRTWENGYRNMSLADACDCANLFDCTLDELAGYTPEPKSNIEYFVMRLSESEKDAILKIAKAFGDDQ